MEVRSVKMWQQKGITGAERCIYIDVDHKRVVSGVFQVKDGLVLRYRCYVSLRA